MKEGNGVGRGGEWKDEDSGDKGKEKWKRRRKWKDNWEKVEEKQDNMKKEKASFWCTGSESYN